MSDLLLRRRSEVEALSTAQAIYTVLSTLQVGDRVPEQCYILDYRDGTIPPWLRIAGGLRWFLSECSETSE